MSDARRSIKRRVEALEAALGVGAKIAYRVRFAFYDAVPGEADQPSIRITTGPSGTGLDGIEAIN